VSHPGDRTDDEPETTGDPAMPRPREGSLSPGNQFVGGDDRPDTYELVDEAGRGGEGVTWRALDHCVPTPALCAVKQLSRPARAGRKWPTEVDRRRLLQHTRLLQHHAQPHIVRVMDLIFGAPPHPPGQPDTAAPKVAYLVMEWVDGLTLRQRCAGRPATAETLFERLKYMSQLAEALAALAPTNANATLHRDIKPSNCIVNDRRGLVLIDVTTLRLADDGFDAIGLHTPEYAAPEVIAAPRRGRTAATEMYSLGAVAAFCLTGTDPPSAQPGDTRDSWLGELLHVAAAAGVADPEALVRHLLTALDPEPTNRPTDFRGWADTIIQLAVRPPTADIAAAPKQGSRRPRRRALVLVGLGALLAVAAGTAATQFVDVGSEHPTQTQGSTAPGSLGKAPQLTESPTATLNATATPTPQTPAGSRTQRPPGVSPTSSPRTTPPAVIARGTITAPTAAANVHSCAYFSGTATLPPETTLILTKRNLDNGNPTVYAELVHGWPDPASLTSWEGAQFFGQGDESTGQRYEVTLRAVPMSAARKFNDSGQNDFGQAIAQQGKQLDSVVVDRIAGEGPSGGGCPRRT
jgi:serine/threonine protein kinase